LKEFHQFLEAVKSMHCCPSCIAYYSFLCICCKCHVYDEILVSHQVTLIFLFCTNFSPFCFLYYILPQKKMLFVDCTLTQFCVSMVYGGYCFYVLISIHQITPLRSQCLVHGLVLNVHFLLACGPVSDPFQHFSSYFLEASSTN
jgi:hypothetical protein